MMMTSPLKRARTVPVYNTKSVLASVVMELELPSFHGQLMVSVQRSYLGMGWNKQTRPVNMAAGDTIVGSPCSWFYPMSAILLMSIVSKPLPRAMFWSISYFTHFLL